MAHKLRLGDGSVIELGKADVRSWYERGLINDDTPVQRAGSTRWTRLADVEDVRGWRGPARAKAARRPANAPAARTPSRGSGGARTSFPSPWPRRMALGVGALLAVAAAFFTTDMWLPAVKGWMAALGGGTAGQPAAAAEEDPAQRHHREAVQAAVAELPLLTRETVEGVMASSAAGVLDPQEVFRRSYEAAGRGLAALTAAEAQELGALNQSLSAALSARERGQLADYIERVRGRRPTSPAEDAEMSRLVRRGTTALGAARRARLQALFSKAVGAALARPAAAAQPPEGVASPAATR
jgi:hypothetical protein